MSLLTIVQDVAKRLGLDSPSTVVGNTDKTVVQLLALLEQAGQEVRDDYIWPQLTKEHTFTLSNGTASYALPSDFDYVLDQTHWDRSNTWPLIGPVDAQEWQRWKSGITTTPNRKVFRVKGSASTQFFIHPTPDAGDDGNTFVYEYQSKNWIVTSGPTERETFAADADTTLLKESLLKNELLWRWRRTHRLDYADERLEAENAWRAESASLRGSEQISLSGKRRGYLLGYDSIPESGYGS